MTMQPLKILSTSLALGLLLQACALPNSYSYKKESAMPEAVKLSPRLQQLFARTKMVCIGRYALEIPFEAELVWGPAGFPSNIEILHGGIDAAKDRIASDLANIKTKDKTAELISNQTGPVKGSWQIQFYEGESSKKYHLLTTKIYINKGSTTFITGRYGTVTDPAAVEEATYIAKNLRLRAAEEVPTEPGFCIDEAFIPDNRYFKQESANAGIFIPSFAPKTVTTCWWSMTRPIPTRPICRGSRHRPNVPARSSAGSS